MAPKIAAMQLTAEGTVRTVAVAPKAPGAVRIEGGRLMHAGKPLTDAFAAIDSFDVSTERGEVVFSARREGGFDIGLVALEGSPVSWFPADPADEVQVSWAPRGNKVAYVLRTRSGDYIRTLHVPTAFELTNEFPYARIRALAWDPPGDRYAAAYDSVDASARVEVMRYGGEERRMAVPPAVKLDVTVEPFGDALLLAPGALRYGEKLPVVVWITDDRSAWDDARAALQRNARVACLVTTKAPDAKMVEELRAKAWIDVARGWVVDAGVAPAARPSSAAPQWDWIAGDPSIGPGRYLVRGRSVLVSPSVVKSFAAGFIQEQLKGTPPPNGISR